MYNLTDPFEGICNPRLLVLWISNPHKRGLLYGFIVQIV